MIIKLYQLDMDKAGELAYMSLAEMQEWSGNIYPDGENYNLVYEGRIRANDLEDLLSYINFGPKPSGFTGDSMSPSDVVEVVSQEDSDIRPGFYYCDAVGFTEVEFDPPKKSA